MKILLPIALVFLLGACAAPPPAPIAKPDTAAADAANDAHQAAHETQKGVEGLRADVKALAEEISELKGKIWCLRHPDEYGCK